MLDPRRLLRWIYIGRMSVAVAIFLAAVRVWTQADVQKLLIASLTFALATAVTVASAAYTEIYPRPLRTTFLYLQSISDLLLVTAVVHVTGGASSQFAALYILVIAASTLILPLGGGLLIAALGNVLYVADVVFGGGPPLTYTVWMQLSVFAAVALGSAYLAAQLRRGEKGRRCSWRSWDSCDCRPRTSCATSAAASSPWTTTGCSSTPTPWPRSCSACASSRAWARR